ncbi:MAG: tetratricopeptide repeat protein [Bacteroidales bacterium]|jgi:tetratricopeptide (TPR) repeat protein|nr:tetratricopeptide repeat protein [Bacteroidales bacterium]
MIQNFRKLLLSLFLFSLIISAFGQKNIIFTDADRLYKNGLELFNKEKYGSAQQQFNEAIQLYGKNNHEFKANAEYYSALCAIELFNDDAEYLMSKFIAERPENSKVNSAYFHMGKFQYRQNRHAKAIFWYTKLNKQKLNKEELYEYYFKLGYSYFVTKDYEKASAAFYEIKDVNTKYTAPANYYYSHIAYQNKNYETALKGFQRLTDNETFAPVVPYYITQIYYLQGKYNEVISYAPALIESASAKRAPEIAKVLGDSYYKKQQYADGVKYLEMHAKNAPKVDPQDYYQLGYTYYKIKQYDSAVVSFEKAVVNNDQLAQNAYFHLADCYMELGQKNRAQQAFEFASKLDFDPQIKEEALFNYALLTYELFHSPFNEAIDAFHKFINLYPNSYRIDDAYNFLVMAYLYTGNYKEALSSLDKIKDKDHAMNEAYQKVAYYRGLELYNNLYFEQSVETFDKSLQYPAYNKAISAQGHYWKAEALYQLNDFSKAIDEYNQFLLTPGSFQLEEYNLAHYNLGYAHFKLKQYNEAIPWFRKYSSIAPNDSTPTLSDAYNRIGDSYFMNKTYWMAIDYYDKAIQAGKMDKDYTLFQRGFSFGLLTRPEKKIESLQRLITEHPESAYIDDALFEMGKSYLELKNEEKAYECYLQVLNNYPSSSYLKPSLVQLGLISYNKDKNEEALSYYKRVVEDFPGTTEAKNALIGIKNIYVDMNNVDGYFAYVNSLGKIADVSQSEQDSLTFISAEKLYMKGDCQGSIDQLKNYIQKYSNGNFILNAHFYIADCYNRTGDKENAINSYNFVINKPKNTFTEQALLSASALSYKDSSYTDALNHYIKLEEVAELNSSLIDARVGQMRSYAKLNDNNNTVLASDKVLHTEKVSEELKREARYRKGKALYADKKNALALDEFRILSRDVNSAEGAESKYLICEIYFNDKQTAIAEYEIFDFIDQKTSQEYWLAKTFILLADVYIQKNDVFQAKHTLKSIIDNYNPDANDEILITAKEKYNKIVEDEKYELSKDKSEEIEITF